MTHNSSVKKYKENYNNTLSQRIFYIRTKNNNCLHNVWQHMFVKYIWYNCREHVLNKFHSRYLNKLQCKQCVHAIVPIKRDLHTGLHKTEQITPWKNFG